MSQDLRGSVKTMALASAPPHGVLGAVIKRSFDFVVALIGLVALSPLFGLIAVLIKRDSPGPVFYWGPRIGWHGVVFHMLKFSTMYEIERSYRGPRVTCKDDDRITRVGKWLRGSKLNELPQLWNVLIGEMSIVGPRPEDPTISKTWPVDVAQELLSVRPGITSPASILYRDEESMLRAGQVMRKYLHELSPDKMRLDQLYVQYQSFWLDLDVIFWTAALLLLRLKTYSPPEKLLFAGPITRLFLRYINWFVWDLAVALAATVLAGTMEALLTPLRVSVPALLGMAFGYCVLFSIVGLMFKTNLIKWPKATAWQWANLWGTWFAVTALVLGIHRQLGASDLRSYEMILLAGLISMAGFTFGRSRERLVGSLRSRLQVRRRNGGAPRTRVLIVGSGRTAEHIAWLMDHPTYSAKFEVAGFIDDDLLSQGMKIYGSRVIGQIKDIPQLLAEHEIKLIVLADTRMAECICQQFAELTAGGTARMVMVPDIFGALAGLDCTSMRKEAGKLNDFRWLIQRPERQRRAWRAEVIASKAKSVARKSRAAGTLDK